jgi:hypothetical protein
MLGARYSPTAQRKFGNELERGMFGDQFFSQCTANERA